MKKTTEGSKSTIYKKYLPLFDIFLQEWNVHDIDNDGVLWCCKNDLIKFLEDKIEDDDANAIAHIYCANNAKTAEDMMRLIQKGKEYICHRIYNQLCPKKLERRKSGRNVTHFRLLKDGEKRSIPQPDSVYIMKALFKANNQLKTNKAYQLFTEKLNPDKFTSNELKLKEWNRVVNKLVEQKCLVCKNGTYIYTHKKIGSMYKRK